MSHIGLVIFVAKLSFIGRMSFLRLSVNLVENSHYVSLN